VSWNHLVLPVKPDPDYIQWLVENSGRALDRLPLDSRIPTARQVITALTDAGCYGALNFEAAGDANEAFRRALKALANAPGSSAFDLNEISLQDARHIMHSVDAETAVTCVSFRSIDGEPLLRAVFALTQAMGAVAVVDAGAGDQVRAVLPTDDIDTVRTHWPW